jgi:hypothetical protein
MPEYPQRFLDPTGFEAFRPIFNGDVNKWWESLPEEQRKPYDDRTAENFLSQRPTQRSRHANDGLIQWAYGLSNEEADNNIDLYRKQYSEKIGLKPEQYGDQLAIYKRTSELFAAAEVDRTAILDGIKQARQDVVAGKVVDASKWADNPLGEAAYKTSYLQSGKEWLEVSKKYRGLLQVLKEEKGVDSNVTSGLPEVDAIFGLGKDESGKNFTKGMTPEDQLDFITNASDDEFFMVRDAINARNKGSSKDKGTIQVTTESLFRAVDETLGAMPFVQNRAHTLHIRQALIQGEEIRIRDQLKEIAKDSPLGLFNSVASSMADTGYFGSRPATPEERKELEKQVTLSDRLVARRKSLADSANRIVDPTNSTAYHEWISNVMGTVPYMGASLMNPWLSAPLVTSVIGEGLYYKMMGEHPDMDPDVAFVSSMVAGAASGLVERTGWMLVFGKVRMPYVSDAILRMNSGAARFGARFGVATVIENAQEAAQKFTENGVQDLLRSLDKDVPSVDWAAEYKNYAKEVGDTFLTLLPFALLGSGAQSFNDYNHPELRQKLMRDTEDRAGLTAAGYSKKQQEEIIAAKTPEGRIEKLQEFFDERVPLPPSPQLLSMKQKLLDSGFAKTKEAEEQAEANAQAFDAALRAAAAKSGMTLDEVYSKVGFDADGQTGDLMQPVTPELGSSWRAAVDAGDMAGAQAAVDQAAKAAGFNQKGARSGHYKNGIPELPSSSSNLGAAYYAVLEGTIDDVSPYANSPLYNGRPEGVERSVGEVYIKLGDNTLTLNHPSQINDWIRSNGLDQEFLDWLDKQEKINSEFKQRGESRPDTIEARRAGNLYRKTVDSKKAKKATLLAKGYSDVDIEALGLNKEHIETPDTGKMFSFLFDSGRLDSVVVDWDSDISQKSGSNRRGKEIAVANPSQIKSADPVTYDDQGNVIPLEERFNTASNDIRYQPNTIAVDRAVAFREALNLDDAEARSTMLANLPSQVTLQEVTDPDLPGEPMYRALLGSPSEVTGQTDNDALLIGESEEKPTLAQVQEMITDGMAYGLLTQEDVAGITMVEAGGELQQGNKGYIKFLEDGKVLLKALEGADASTFIHELGHFVRRYALSDDHVQTIGDYYGVEDGDWAADYKMWKSRGDVGSSAEERFAKDFERYFYDGKLPENADSALVKAFKVLKELMHEVYKALKGSPIATSIDPDVRAAIDSVFEGKRLDVNSLPGMPASPAAMRTAEMADPVMEAPADGHLYSLVSEQEVDEDVLFQPDTGEKITEKQMFGDRESGVYHVVQANAELIAAVKPHFDAESLDLSDPTDQALAGMYFARGVELVDQNFNPDPDLDGAQQALHAEITEFARRMWSKMGDGAPYAWVMNNPAMQATKIARELQARSIYAKTTIDATKEKIDENMVSMLDNLNPEAKKGKGGTGLKLKDLERIIDGIVPEASAEIATEIQKLVDERKKNTPKKGTAGKLADDEVKEKENREKLEAKIKKLTDKRVQAYIKKFSEAGSDPPLYEKAKKAKLEDELAALVRKQLSQYPLTRDEFLLRAAELDIEHADASELFNSSQDERDRQIRIKQYRDLLRREKATRDNNNATARRIIAAIAETQSDTQSWVDKRKPVNPVREAYKELLKPGPIRSKDAFIKLLPEADIELVSRLYDAAMLERRAAAEVKRVFTPGLLLKRSIPAIQKQLLANPLLSISSEEQRIKLATEYFVENGMARPDAERAAAMFIDEFTRNLGAARVANAEKFIKRNGPLERVLKQPTKNKKTYYDKLMETIRSGALDGRLRITEELAKENGWSGLNTEANEKLMILDEKLRDPDAGLHEKAELNMAVEEVVFNAGLPMSFLDMASPYYCLSIFSSFKTLTGLQLSPLPYTLLAATTRDLGIAILNGNLHGHMLAIKAYTHALIGPGFSEGLFALKTGKQVTADPDMRQSINRLQVAMDQNMAILKNPASNAWEKGKAFLKTLIASEKLFGNVITAMDAWMTKSSRDYIATSQRSMALKNVGLPDGGAALQEIMEAVNHDRQGYERLAVTRFPSPTMDLSATGALEKADALWEFKKDLSANVQRRSIWVEDMLQRDILNAIAGKGVSEEHIKEMETIAKNEAGMTTGIHDVEGFFKKPFDAMQSWMNTPGIEGLAWRATLAAVKTPGNIVNYGRNWLPGYAIFRAWRQNRADVGSKPFPVSYGTVAQQQMRMHETIWGTVMWATMIAMLKDNEDKEPKDQYFRMNSVGPPKGSAAYEVWKSEGRKPNTFQFRIGGDKWTTIGFRGGGLETISIALTPIAAYEQAKINNPEMLRNGEGLNVWAYAMTAFSELASEQFFPLRGLLPLMGQSDSRRTSEENQQQRAARYAGYKLSSWLWGSSFMRSFNRFDDYKQSDTWQQAFIHSFPIPSLLAEGYALNGLGDHVGGGAEDIFDKTAAFGYPLGISEQKPILSAADDPEKWVYVVNTRLLKGISKMSKQSWEKWVGREITPDEFAKLTTLRGKATKEAANRAFPDMKSLEAADMDAIEKLKDRYSKQVTDVVSRKFNSKTAASYLK